MSLGIVELLLEDAVDSALSTRSMYGDLSAGANPIAENEEQILEHTADTTGADVAAQRLAEKVRETQGAIANRFFEQLELR